MPNPYSTPAGRSYNLTFLSLAASILLAVLVLSCGETEESTAPAARTSDTPVSTTTTAPTEAPPTTAPDATRAPDPTKAPDPTQAPTATTAPEPTQAPEATQAPDEAQEPARVFEIVAGSQGLFKVDETLRGVDVVVALETEEITGSIDIEAGTVTVELNLHSLVSDQPRRDRYVRERLFPSQPIATVEFADLGDIPDSFFETGEELAVTLPATVNVNGVDAELEFEVTARLDSDEDLVVLGITEFVWADFGMTAPVSSIFAVEDEVRAELLLYAKAN